MDPLQPVPHVSLMMDTFIANSNVEEYASVTSFSCLKLPTNVELCSLRAIVRALLVSGPPNTTAAFQKVVKQRLRRQRLADKSSLPAPSSLYASFNSRHPYSSSSSASSSASLAVSDSFSAPASAFSTPPSSSAGSPRISSTQDLASGAAETDPVFTPHAHEIVSRARALFGAGLGLASLPLLTLLIHGTHKLRWSEDGTFVDALAILDGDISQAIQSSTEEIAQQAVAQLVSLNPTSPPSVGMYAPSQQQTSSVEENWTEEGCKAVVDLRNALKACESEVEGWGGEFPFQRGLANVEWLEQSDTWTKTMTGDRR